MNLDLGDTRLLIDECKRQGLLRNQAAYVLGTAKWETAHTMEPVREALAESDEQSKNRLERAWKAGRLSWVSRPYWRTGFFGRGYVQLTHEGNYARAGAFLGIDLVSDPSRALEPHIAAQIIVIGMRDGWFTGKRLDDYITLQASNYRGARRIVNGTDQANAIAELARDYEEALKAIGYGIEPAAPVVNERRDGTAPRESIWQSRSIMAQVRQLAGKVMSVGGAWWGAQSETTQMALIAGGVVLVGVLIYAHGSNRSIRERLHYWAEGVR